MHRADGGAGSGRDNHSIIEPAGWPRPKGFSYGVAASGRIVFLSGIIGTARDGKLVAREGPGGKGAAIFLAQARQALTNIRDLLAAADVSPAQMTRMTWYIVDRAEYLACQSELGAAYREVLGRTYPAMAVVQVVALVEEGARVEIEVTAVKADS